MARLQRVNPILNVADVPASIAYYTDRLGFSEQWSWGDPVTFGGVIDGDVEVMFCKDGQGSPGTWFTIWVDDVDALYDDFRARGADIRHEPVDLPWGIREMNVADPDGHRIRFSMESGRHVHDEVADPFGP